MRSTLPTARITKFSWAASERFSAEVWYLNDSPDTFHDYVKASMVIGESVIELFNWKTGKIAGGTNKIGPSVNIVLPVISDAVEMILLLESSELGITNKYRLLYHAPKLKKKTLTLNM